MRALLILVIRLYWMVVPVHRRRSCLFKESCSMHVYHRAAASGFIAGLRALWFRYRNCRAGYVWIHIGDHRLLITHAGAAIPAEQIAIPPIP